jgi:hypothetical protein
MICQSNGESLRRKTIYIEGLNKLPDDICVTYWEIDKVRI